MSIKGKYSESAPLYFGLLGAGVAAAIAVFIIVYSSLSGAEGSVPQRPVQSDATVSEPSDAYVPDKELSEEMKDSAEKLLTRNYEVLKLYYTRGLPHKDEPYGNEPEDGYYTVDSSEYTSIEQLEELVDSTYTKEQAETVKENSLGYGPIYKERDNGTLGIIANFTEMPYELIWEDPKFSIHPESDELCGISLTLLRGEDGEETEISGQMIKTDDGWRLQSVVF